MDSLLDKVQSVCCGGCMKMIQMRTSQEWEILQLIQQLVWTVQDQQSLHQHLDPLHHSLHRPMKVRRLFWSQICSWNTSYIQEVKWAEAQTVMTIQGVREVISILSDAAKICVVVLCVVVVLCCCIVLAACENREWGVQCCLSYKLQKS